MQPVSPATPTQDGAPHTTPLDQLAADHAQARATNARHRALLDELIDMGMDMARMVHAQAKSEAATPPEAPAADHSPIPDLTAAFDRITRCVRRTVLMAEHLAKPLPDPAQHARTQAASAEATLAIARRHLARRVEYLIADHIPAGPRADAMHREAMDRLDGLDVIEDLRTLPVNQIAFELGEDLHLFCRSTRRRTPADAARLARRAHGHPQPPGPPTRPEAGPPLWTHRDDPGPRPPSAAPDLRGMPPADQALIRQLLAYTPGPPSTGGGP